MEEAAKHNLNKSANETNSENGCQNFIWTTALAFNNKTRGENCT
jgi:hypothetical protein